MKKNLVVFGLLILLAAQQQSAVAATYSPISSHAWALIAKNPNAYKGKNIQVYGQVDQFDTFTGTKQFLGDTDGVNEYSNGFWVSTYLESLMVGTTSMFAQLAQGDIYRANVTVLGTFSYSTRSGAKNTIVKLGVKSITYLGSAK